MLRKRILKCWFGLPKSSFGEHNVALGGGQRAVRRTRLVESRLVLGVGRFQTRAGDRQFVDLVLYLGMCTLKVAVCGILAL